MDLPSNVALRTSSYDGSVIARLADLHSDWIFSRPGVGEAPYMEEPALLAEEESDAAPAVIRAPRGTTVDGSA